MDIPRCLKFVIQPFVLYLTCDVCSRCRYEREEIFFALNVTVKNATLQDSLDQFVKGELLEGDNAYFCEKCGQKVCWGLQAEYLLTSGILSIHKNLPLRSVKDHLGKNGDVEASRMQVVYDRINPCSAGATSWFFPAMDETSLKPPYREEAQRAEEMSEPAYRQRLCKMFVISWVDDAYSWKAYSANEMCF